jgi:prepilin-type N-terminal cleavage/methylation domain-containing protein
MHKHAGFTLIELAVVIAIIGIASAIAVPNMIGWAADSRVNGAARDVVTMIQKARIEAVKRNALVVVTFDAADIGAANTDFLAYLDDGQGGGGADNWIQDGSERTVYSGQLPAGVTISNISLGTTVDKTRFNPRAMPSAAGPITLTNSRGYTVTINLGTGGIPTI